MVRKNPKKSLPFQKIYRRSAGLGAVFLLGFAVIGVRSFELHLTDNHKLSKLAQNQYMRRVVVAPKRGTILDSQGETLAIDIQVASVYANPKAMSAPEKVATQLAEALSIPRDKIFEKIKQQDKKFVWIKRRVTPEESNRIKALKLEGVGELPEYKRHYPNKSLAANLLGAVGYDALALAGMEMSLDKILKSQEPPVLVEQDAKGRSYAPYALIGVEHPNQVTLTIDKTIQYIAERELQVAVDKAQAKGGIALVVEVKTGAILAMATEPSFDPNEYFKHDVKNWRNRAINDAFEPGSIFKALTAAAALEYGVIDTEKKLFCENGSYRVGKNTIHDHHGYGALNISDIIKYSSNICSYKLANQVGIERFSEFIRNFGFGSKTGIAAPGEIGGILASAKRLSSIQLGTIGFGQGISTTPLQIAMAYAAIANDGVLMKPWLVREVLDSKGNVVEKHDPETVRQALSPTTAKLTAKLLETVVDEGGTGTAARLEGYRVAGKTGTAQKVDEGKKGYAKDKYFSSFVGFAPAEAPKLVVLVSIDEPKGSYYGGVVSAPVFQKVMGQSLAYLKVSPEVKAIAATSSKKSNKSPLLSLQAPPKIETAEEPITVTHEEAANQLNDEKAEVETLFVPDLTGLTVREALRRASAQKLKVKIIGSGLCQHQYPAPGSVLEAGAAMTLECKPPI